MNDQIVEEESKDINLSEGSDWVTLGKHSKVLSVVREFHSHDRRGRQIYIVDDEVFCTVTLAEIIK